MRILPPGTRIGSYEITSKPMNGNMGVVYPCFDFNNERLVALKTFRHEFLPDLAARDLFLREGTGWMDLGNCPYIVRCFGVEHVDDGNEIYLVLEFVSKEDGFYDASLRSWLIPGKPLAVDRSLLFALQIARGMHHASIKVNGFVHRDLKPENLLISKDKLPNSNANRLLITDFGLSCIICENNNQYPQLDKKVEGINSTPMIWNRTQLANGIAGTPLYMAPEQWLGKPSKTATDIYAFGCILYEMLAGNTLVTGKNNEEAMQKHLTSRFEPLPSNLSNELTYILKTCLALSIEQRFKNWEQVINILDEVYLHTTGQISPVCETSRDLTHAEQISLGWGYSILGGSYLEMGKIDTSQSYFERMRTIAKNQQSEELESGALNNLGSVFLEKNELEKAIECFTNSLKIKRKIGSEVGMISSLENLGIVYSKLKNYSISIKYLEGALFLSRKTANIFSEGHALGNLGYVAIQHGDLSQALTYLNQAIKIDYSTGNIKGIGPNLINLSNVYLKLDDIDQALAFAIKAEEIYASQGDPKIQEAQDNIRTILVVKSMKLVNDGVAQDKIGNIDNAILCYEKSLEISNAINDGGNQAKALGNLGIIYYLKGEENQALMFFEKARKIAREIENPEEIFINSFRIAGLLTGLNGFVRALKLVQEAYDIGKRINNPKIREVRMLEGGIYNNLGEIYRNDEEFQKAKECYQEALSIGREIGDHYGEGIALGNLGLVEMIIGDNKDSNEHLELALAADIQSGNSEAYGIAKFNLALLYQQEGNIDRALVCAQNCLKIFIELDHPNIPIVRNFINELCS